MKLKAINSVIKTILACLLLLGFALNTSYAAPSVSHSHEGRKHAHSLPKTGIKHYHKHMHNGRAHIHPYTAKIGFNHTHNKSSRAKAWANAVKHQHGGRPHTHPLPKSGIKHLHRHKHGGRSHIHPLPVSGVNHFHKLNQQNHKRVANVSNKSRMITGLSIQQQIAAVLKTTPSANKQKNTVSRAVVPKSKVPKSKVSKPIASKRIVAKRIKTNASQKSPQRNIPVMNQRTINKVLGVHSHNGRRHQHPSQIAGAKHTHRKAVKTQKRKPTRKVLAKKRNPIKKPQIRKAPPKAIKAKIAKRSYKSPIKAMPAPRKSQQTPQQITEGNRQFTLALRYENGTGVKKNLPQAFNWYQRAANNGNTKAQFNLASLYENGEGTKQNIPQAIRWYTTAANNGDANAQVNLGNRYAEGKNVPKNIQLAAKWYKRAADQGDVRGRANLNYLIEDYNGVIKR